MAWHYALSAIWVKNCGRDDLMKSIPANLHSAYVVCNLHFEKDMFSSLLMNRLKKNAVPTLFDSVLELPHLRHAYNNNTKASKGYSGIKMEMEDRTDSKDIVDKLFNSEDEISDDTSTTNRDHSDPLCISQSNNNHSVDYSDLLHACEDNKLALEMVPMSIYKELLDKYNALMKEHLQLKQDSGITIKLLNSQLIYYRNLIEKKYESNT